MAHVPDKQLNAMLSALPKRERAIYSGILKANATHVVRCNRAGKSPEGSKHRKGAKVAEIFPDGTCRPIRDDDGLSWLRSDRVRTDGSRGFECWCGNDSRRLKEEEAVFDKRGNPPDQSKLASLLQKVGGTGTPVSDITTKEVVDGFTIEKVK